MKPINESIEIKYSKYPEKILQLGEGNFLRAFADWMIDLANESKDLNASVVLCQPIAQGLADKINAQQGAYTLVMRGIEDNEAKEVVKQITSVSRCLNPYTQYEDYLKLAASPDLTVFISNTTEAGIAYKEGDKLTDTPPASFPAKVTAFLYQRFKTFNGDNSKGLLFLPVELIDYNGTELKKIVLRYAKEWALEDAFIKWIEDANKFTNTLVDRIVTGYPKDEIEYFENKLGYKDDIIVTSEIFNLWVIEGKKEWAEIFPIHKTKANVIWTEDVKPYKMRKVRILNGGHTSTVLAAYLAGHNIVLDFMKDPLFLKYLDKLMYQEIIPTLDLPEQELKAFADAVKDRFANPYIKHKLLDISLNSASKFNARCMPSLVEYYKRKGALPDVLTFSLAAFIKFYQGTFEGGAYMGKRADGTMYQIKDDAEVIKFFSEVWQNADSLEVASKVLGNASLWSGNDIAPLKGLKEKVAFYLEEMKTKPIEKIIEELGN